MTDLRRVRGRGQADLALPGGAGLHTTRGYKRCQGGGVAGGVAVQGVGSVCVNVDNNVCVLLVRVCLVSAVPAAAPRRSRSWRPSAA